MRTQRINYGELARKSVKRDLFRFNRSDNKDHKPEINTEPEFNSERRIIFMSNTSAYYQYARFIVGRLVRVKEKASIGSSSYYCEFVHENDRMALNNAANWSDRKREYLFDGIKFA